MRYGFALLGRVGLLAGGLLLSACVTAPAAVSPALESIPVRASISGSISTPAPIAVAAVKLPVPPELQSAAASLPAFVAPTLPAAAAPVVVTVPAPAPVVIGWGDYVLKLLDVFGPLLILLAPVIAAPILHRIPGPTGAMIRFWATDQRIKETLGLALNATAGAAKGKALSVDVASPVLARVMQTVANEWPAAAIRLAGGEEAIRAKVIAKLDLEPDATLEALAAVK